MIQFEYNIGEKQQPVMEFETEEELEAHVRTLDNYDYGTCGLKVNRNLIHWRIKSVSWLNNTTNKQHSLVRKTPFQWL